MTVGILGLGLIGGSMARASALAGHTVVQGKELQISYLEASVSGGQDS